MNEIFIRFSNKVNNIIEIHTVSSGMKWARNVCVVILTNFLIIFYYNIVCSSLPRAGNVYAVWIRPWVWVVDVIKYEPAWWSMTGAMSAVKIIIYPPEGVLWLIIGCLSFRFFRKRIYFEFDNFCMNI